MKVSNWWLLRLVFSLSAFYERRDVAVAGVCGFAEQVLSSWPCQDSECHIGRCSFGPGVPGQSAQLLLLEGIGYVWLFFRASPHDLIIFFKVQAN